MSYNLTNNLLCQLLLILVASCNHARHPYSEINPVEVIDLKSAEVINEFATGNALSMIDEQQSALNILYGKNESLKTKWVPEKRTAIYPVSVILNLKAS